ERPRSQVTRGGAMVRRLAGGNRNRSQNGSPERRHRSPGRSLCLGMVTGSVLKLLILTASPTTSIGDEEKRRMTSRFWYRIATVSLLIVGFAAMAAAQRNSRNWDGYPNWGGSFDLRQTALNAGFNEGSKEGRNDRSRNRSRNYNDFDVYRNATKDYSSRMGDEDLYRRYFRTAFEHGYDAE